MTEWSSDDEESKVDSPIMVLLVSLTGLVAGLQLALHTAAPIGAALLILS